MSADMAVQMAKVRRESIRWHLLAALHVSRPVGAYTELLLPVIQAAFQDATDTEIRRELDYLEDRKLVTIAKDSLNRWLCELNHYGVDVVEYTIECLPGIARPKITG